MYRWTSSTAALPVACTVGEAARRRSLLHVPLDKQHVGAPVACTAGDAARRRSPLHVPPEEQHVGAARCMYRWTSSTAVLPIARTTGEAARRCSPSPVPPGKQHADPSCAQDRPPCCCTASPAAVPPPLLLYRPPYAKRRSSTTRPLRSSLDSDARKEPHPRDGIRVGEGCSKRRRRLGALAPGLTRAEDHRRALLVLNCGTRACRRGLAVRAPRT